MAVRCDGIASDKHYLRSTSDLTIIHERINEHIARLKKIEDEDLYEDTYFCRTSTLINGQC